MNRDRKVSAGRMRIVARYPSRMRRLLAARVGRAAGENASVWRALRSALQSLRLVSMCFLLLAHSASAAVPEYKIQAALIIKIGKFVRWPEGAFSGAGGTLRLCIVGRDDFGESIDSLAGQTLQGRVIAISRLSAPEESETECRIVFISASERDRVAAFLTSIARSPALTISDIDGFAAQGGMVGFATTASKIHFEINAAASKRAGLEIGAQLLQLSTLVADRRLDVKP
jgi:hypothetical protein